MTDIYQFRNRYRLEPWRNKDYQFIHVPKCAGTSVAKAIGLPDPGHFTFDQLKNAQITTESNVNFVVVRNPLARLVSTFKYAKKAQQKNGWNPLSWVAQYSDFDDFICTGLDESDLEKNYFFWTSSTYISGCPEEALEIIDFDRVEDGFREVMELLNLGGLSLPKENVSKKEKVCPSRKAQDKIFSLYKDDYTAFPERLGVCWK
ncbi:sulfotransferase family 2 domain-containing protein [Alcanivorax marinus]|nr:sulfotransferase family 2 domain-containing protein [Alloalcanivorax marinus]